MFKKGDRIKCLKRSYVCRLTKDKIYVVLADVQAKTVCILNDDGRQVDVRTYRFELERENLCKEIADNFFGIDTIAIPMPEHSVIRLKDCICPDYGPNGVFSVGCTCGAIVPYKAKYA